MTHPLIEGARWRFARISRIGDYAPSELPPGFALRTARLGNRVPLILAPVADPTAQHFFDICVAADLHVAWISHDDIAVGAVTFRELSHAVTSASGVYLREPLQESVSEIAVGATIRAVAQAALNLVAPSRASTNWSKLLHIATLRASASGAIRLPLTSVVSSLRSHAAGVVKGLSSMPTLAHAAGDIAPTQGWGPLLLQEKISGQEVRFHIIDGNVFGCAIESPALDYRTSDSNKLYALSFDDWDLAALSDMIDSEGLRFSGIDIIRTHDALYVLEINPSPGYQSYERAIDPERAGITRALYAALIRAPQGGRTHQ